jgi:hypothetical protein
MNAPLRTSRPILRASIVLAIAIGTLLLNGLVAVWLWAEGVNFATIDRVQPGESGFRIDPIPGSYKWLLSAVFVVNVGVLMYLLAKKKRQYALSFAAGAAMPMGYILYTLASG